MDTVEWGTGEPSGKRPGRLRSTTLAAGGRGAAAVLAVLGFITLIAAEVLPWGMLHLGSADTGDTDRVGRDLGNADPAALARAGSLGLDRLDFGSTFVYRLGTLLLLAIVGAALFGRPALRRAVFGVGLGVLAAQVLVVVAMVHSFSMIDPLSSFALGALEFQATPTVTSTSVESGTFCAFASLALLLAALVLSAMPGQVRSRLVAGSVEPVAAHPEEQPLELTVAPATPLDEAYFSRPDGYPR